MADTDEKISLIKLISLLFAGFVAAAAIFGAGYSSGKGALDQFLDVQKMPLDAILKRVNESIVSLASISDVLDEKLANDVEYQSFLKTRPQFDAQIAALEKRLSNTEENVRIKDQEIRDARAIIYALNHPEAEVKLAVGKSHLIPAAKINIGLVETYPTFAKITIDGVVNEVMVGGRVEATSASGMKCVIHISSLLFIAGELSLQYSCK